MIRILIVLQLILTFSLSNYIVSDELKAIERICEKVHTKDIYIGHGYAKYLLDTKGKRLQDIGQAKPGDKVLWDSHRARLILPINYFGEIQGDMIEFKGWKLLADDKADNFIIILLEKL